MLSLTHKIANVSIFDQVSRNLASIGCIPLSDYLYGSPSIPAATVPQETLSAPQNAAPIQHSQPPTPAITKTSVDTVSPNAISRLHQTSQRTFGSIEPLKFEFIEEAGQRSKKCILTISRPNGSTRSYATDPVYSRKSDAKSAAATLAIEMGALDFITRGDPEELKLKRGLVLASINSSQNQERTRAEIGSTHDQDGNNAIEQIETCCAEWRGGSIAPHWVALLEPKVGHTQGCALRIELSPHVIKIYASDTIYNTYNEAKAACAEGALREGALDFIKHGNGQLRPASPQLYSTPSSSDINGVSANKQPPLTLQAFYESLPRPFPESFESKDANEIGAPGYMNTLVQNARGGKLTTTFIFTSDGTPGLHGCFLRLDRPAEYRAYLMQKLAVCLQALSHGAGDYMRAIGKAVEARVTPLMKTWVNDQIYPVLLSEYNKVRNRHPNFTYEKEKDAFGCTMTLHLAADPTPDQTRNWTVSNDYRNKADAKVAVICTAIEQGAMEFIRFRGEPPPPGYTTPYSLQTFNPESSQRSNGKRKMVEDAHSQGEHEKPTKRQKKAKLEGTATKHGNKKEKGSTHTHGIPESGIIRAGQTSRKGYVSAPYQPGLGDESGSGTAYPLPQVSLNPTPPTVPDQRFMPHAYSSVQGGYGHPLSAQSFAGPSGSGTGFRGGGFMGADAERLGDSSEPEPGEVV
ncbi:hypothetical protein EV702DRAFT_1147624 [Suillus placidus]|uniref:Uncharacterized protein n=1 Tax=Suillus placidus TaxID=48579 RepID=A0A9P7CWN3_9AGAM|nr:hypothetical protein EV702DRAFT_1147624 [Suillus placidus]